MSIQKPLNSVQQIFKKLGWQSTPEQEQAVLRIAISVIFISYLLLTVPTDTDPNSGLWFFAAQYVGFFLVYALGVFASTLWSPPPSVTRRLFTIVGDIGLLSYGLFQSGGVGAPWYGVYLWVTLGNGFRYGEKYLYVSGVASLTGFVAVVMLSPYWAQHQSLAVGLAVTLLVIPAYSARLIRRLNEARQQADTANKAKSRFLSRMSHEIRTPLNGVLGMAELLQGMPLDKQAHQYVHIIETSGQALNRQIDEILDLSKIEAEQLAIENIEFDLYILIGQTLQMFETQAAKQEVQLIEQLDPQTPFLLKGDPYRLQQIIINLVSNAIKFTRQGSVTLRVSPDTTGDEQVTLRFEVVDTGIGMEESALNTIFDPFCQADVSITREFGGTGLGTTICKNLVELMGGRIGVHSLPGSGTTFWFSLPFLNSENLEENDKNWKLRCRTLYVRHTEQHDNRIPELLNQWYVPFRQTTSLATARELIEKEDAGGEWDAIIVDAWPYDDELDALLHDFDTSSDRPALIFTGKKAYPPALLKERRHYFYLVDINVSPTQLSNALHASYVKHSDDIVHIASARNPEQKEAGESHGLHVLVGDDNRTNLLVVEQMLKRLGHCCDTAEGGEAVLYALEEGAYDAVLIDKNMPDMNGIDVLKAYRYAHAGKDSVPFVLLTADATEESRLEAKEAGINYFLAKPLSIGHLQAALESVSCNEEVSGEDQARSQGRPENSAIAQETSAAENITFNPAILKDLVSFSTEPDEFAGKLIASFKRDAVNNIAGLENAVRDNNFEEFLEIAHALKGSASYVGLVGLEAICKTNETIDADEFNRNPMSLFRQIKNELDAGIKALETQWQGSRQAG